MIRYLKSAIAPLLLLIVTTGCTPLKTLEDGQKTNAHLLEQQAMRLEAQEEYLAQLAESQDELTEILSLVEERARQIEAAIPPPQSQAEEKRPEAAPPQRQAPRRQEVDNKTLDSKQVVGRNEWVWLELLSRNLKARVDTGALSSSLSAVDLLPFERDGREWIRFRVPDEDHPDGGDVYETPLVKYVKIRQASTDEMDRRPVVRLTVRLGDLVDEVEFNLSNRANMLYPVLLGRNFLRDVALVDVAQKFTQPKHQPEEESAQAP